MITIADDSLIEKWLTKFEHLDKWNFCLTEAIMPQISHS